MTKFAPLSFWIYITALHLVLAGVVICAFRRGDGLGALFRSTNGKHEYYYRQMVAFQQRVDEMVPDGSILFIGDSAIQGLDVRAIAENGVNFGIGGDTTAGVLARIGGYRSLDSAETLVLAVGYNDLKSSTNDKISEDLERLLKGLPPELNVICCGIYPTDERIRKVHWNRRIADLNRTFAVLCAGRKGTVFVDFGTVLADGTGNLRSEYRLEDGLHLNLAGRQVVVQRLRAALRSADRK